jgi:hypothetical protein
MDVDLVPSLVLSIVLSIIATLVVLALVRWGTQRANVQIAWGPSIVLSVLGTLALALLTGFCSSLNPSKILQPVARTAPAEAGSLFSRSKRGSPTGCEQVQRMVRSAGIRTVRLEALAADTCRFSLRSTVDAGFMQELVCGNQPLIAQAYQSGVSSLEFIYYYPDADPEPEAPQSDPLRFLLNQQGRCVH